MWPYPACALTVTERKGPFCNLVFLKKNTHRTIKHQNLIYGFSCLCLPVRCFLVHYVCLLSLRACASKLQISKTNVDIGFTADFDRSLDSFVN